MVGIRLIADLLLLPPLPNFENEVKARPRTFLHCCKFLTSPDVPFTSLLPPNLIAFYRNDVTWSKFKSKYQRKIRNVDHA